MSDPLTLVYETLWDLLESGERVRELVKPGNRIKLSGKDRSPFKESVSTDDFPELTLIPSGGNASIRTTTTGCNIVQRFKVNIASGDQRATILLPLKFAVYTAMADWPNALKGLLWKTNKFVVNAKLLDFDDGIALSDLNRGIAALSTVMHLEVTMWFDWRTLISEK